MSRVVATTPVEKAGRIVGHLEIWDGTGLTAITAVSHAVHAEDTPPGFSPILRRHSFGHYERGTSIPAAEAWVKEQAK